MSATKAFAQFQADLAAERKANKNLVTAASVKDHSRAIEERNAFFASVERDAEEHGEIFDRNDYDW